jgi:hypothetical protein
MKNETTMLNTENIPDGTDTAEFIDYWQNNQKFYRCQFAAAVHFENFTGYDIDRGICELLTSGAFDYADNCEAGNQMRAQLALEGTLSYVNTELDEEGYEAYTDGFADCISLALEGVYDEEIDFENGLVFEDEDEFA